MNDMYEVKISSKLIDELSLLYSDKFKAIGEIVINSIDSGATKIWVITQNPSEIVVLDNGSGMTESDIISKYLLFGYSYKQLEIWDSNRRPIAGRKGIAKVSGLSIADKMTITSWKEGTKNEFSIDRNEYTKKKYISDYKIPHKQLEMDGDEIAKHGTEVKLTKLRLSKMLDEKELIEWIAINLPVFFADLEIRVNGLKVERARISYREYKSVHEVHPILGKIEGEIFRAKKSLVPFNGVITRVRGIVVGKPSLFKTKIWGMYSDYLGGEIEFVEAFEKQSEGLITAGREAFVETNPLYQEYEKYMAGMITEFVNKINKVKEDKRRERIKSIADARLNRLSEFVSGFCKERFDHKCTVELAQMNSSPECMYDEENSKIIINTTHPSYRYAAMHKWEQYHIMRCAMEEMALYHSFKEMGLSDEQYRDLKEKMLKMYVTPILVEATKRRKEKEKKGDKK